MVILDDVDEEEVYEEGEEDDGEGEEAEEAFNEGEGKYVEVNHF